jgi:hypothetical protein
MLSVTIEKKSPAGKPGGRLTPAADFRVKHVENVFRLTFRKGVSKNDLTECINSN